MAHPSPTTKDDFSDSSDQETSMEETESYASEDDDDNDETPWHTLCTGFWQQHVVAIVVAVAAALYMQPSLLNKNNSQERLQPHPYLDTYSRLSDVTFCGGLPPRPGLALFDVTLDQAHWDVLRALWKEDENNSNNDEWECLNRQIQNTRTNYIKAVTYYYPEPSIASLYQQDPATSKLQASYLTFTGFAAQFINMDTRQPVLLYWDGPQERTLVGELAPLESVTTATRPGESFSVSPVHDPSHALARWVVTADDNIQYYEPPEQKQQLLSSSSREETIEDPSLRHRYQLQRLNQEFARQYLAKTQRAWHAHFPRPRPVFDLVPADYLGQIHHTDTNELKVLSVRPRVLEIPNFLNATECSMLIAMAQQHLSPSKLFAGGITKQQRNLSTRNSSSTWLARNNMTHNIYRKAAQVLRVPESLLLSPIDDSVDASKHALAESLQLVQYGVGQKYTAHHDWTSPPLVHPHQPTRFATLLLYLNDDFEGGQTVFPKAVTTQFHDGLTIEPQQGKAVLFYNMLPDGNMDDASIHSAEPVISGTKYLATLWMWEPMIH